jgi:serine/threonine-protein kinase
VTGTPFGRYELLRKIAAGGMAEIYLAREWSQGGFFRDLVIKRLFPHLVEHEATLRSFQYEARLMAELRHPNIPQVSELGYADHTWYIAMEYVEGQNVADVWRAGAKMRLPMPIPVALGIVMQVCEALHHAHDRTDRAGRALAIVHRDVTPQNVMLTRDGVAKLMDFGVAQTAANRELDRAVKGTFSYMAPEQVRGWVVDRRADVFSVGVILYELTTGTRLFRGNDVQVMTAVVEQDVPPPSLRVPGYPPDLEAIVVAALRRDRDHRIPTAADLALHLEDFAMRHGLLVGPRTLAHHVQQVLPAARVPEHELAMVAPVELTRRRTSADSSDAWSSSTGFDSEVGLGSEHDYAPPPLAGYAVRGRRAEEHEYELEDELHVITEDELAGGRGHHGALHGFDDDPRAESGPVVLLDHRKPSARSDEYVRELRRRLEDDDRR